MKFHSLKNFNQIHGCIAKGRIIHLLKISRIKYIFLTLASFHIGSVSLLSQASSGKTIIETIDDKLNTIHSIEYACLINNNNIELKDNSDSKARCYLKRDSLDKFGWKVNVTTEEYTSIYNFGIYSISSKRTNEIAVINLSNEGINVNDVIYGSYFNNYLIDFLFENNFFNNLLIDKDLDSYSIDTTHVDGKEVVMLSFLFKDNDLISQIKDSYIFELNTFNPIGILSSYTFNKVKIKEELWLDSIRINSPYIIDTVFHFNLKTDSIFESQNNLENNIDLIIGDHAPEINSKDFNGDVFNLSDFKDQIVIIDFWYIRCAPCIRSLKELSKIKQEFSNLSLVLVGLNNIDSIQDQMDFKSNQNVKHDINLFPSSEIINKYNVSGYPAIFIIGPTGLIINKFIGWGISSAGDLRNFLKIFTNE